MVDSARWRWYLGVCTALSVLYALVPAESAQSVGSVLVHLSAVVAVVAGVRRHRPAVRWPWYALAVNIALYSAGDMAYWIQAALLRKDLFPSVADAFYVPSSIVLVVALVGFVRARRTGWDQAGLLDAAILSTGAGMLAWIYLIAPSAQGGDLPLSGRVVSLAYPVLDLLALAVLVRLTIGAGRRPIAYRLLVAGVAVLLVTDVVYTLLELAGTYAAGGLLDAGWMITHALMGAAALHPAMAAVSQAARPAPAGVIGRGRLISLAAASLLAPMVLGLEWLRGGPLDVPIVVAGCIVLFLLVLARLQGVVQLLADALDTAQNQARTDQLTGLANRRLFHTRWEHALTVNTSPTALLYVDLDGFKTVNDTLGHESGDAVLEAVATRIRAHVRTGDLVARLGGDEFAVILPGASDEHAARIATRIVAAVAEPIIVDGTPVMVGASIGVITAPPGADPDAEIKRADTAMYAAKAAGRGCIHHDAPPTGK